MQLHLSGLSLSNIVSIIEIFDIERARSTVHNWVHKADLRSTSAKSSDDVAFDETVIQLNGDQYRLYASVDPRTNGLLYASLGSTTSTELVEMLLAELSEKHLVADDVFLIVGTHTLYAACHRAGYDYKCEKHGDRNAIERVFRELKR